MSPSAAGNNDLILFAGSIGIIRPGLSGKSPHGSLNCSGVKSLTRMLCKRNLERYLRKRIMGEERVLSE